MTRHPWTTTEEAALRKYWPNKPLLRARLPRRTDQAMQHRARSLGLTLPPRETGWTSEELAWMVNNWGQVSIEVMEHKLNRCWRTIRLKAAKQGLRMGNRRVVDGIRLPIGWEEADYRKLQANKGMTACELSVLLGKPYRQTCRFLQLLRSTYV